MAELIDGITTVNPKLTPAADHTMFVEKFVFYVAFLEAVARIYSN